MHNLKDPVESRAKEIFEREGRADVSWGVVAQGRLPGKNVVTGIGEEARDRFRAMARVELGMKSAD
ncbi:hypothetical protein NKI34_35175 [Mesorhizobium sp. M0700]|uniref:hypothetical protein n=1 Tax=unclassified Mesorhizobium TaxID=325217 RepID=UPI00333E1864